MNSLIQFLLLLTIFLIALLGTNGNFGYEQIKVLFFILSISLIGFIGLVKGFKRTKISKTAYLFILILLITSLTGIDPRTSILGIPPYFQGVILYAYLLLFSLIVTWSKIKLEHWAYVLAGSAILVGFIAIKEWVLLNIFNIQISTYAGRVVSTFGQSNFFAGFLLLTLPFSYLLFKKQNKKLLNFGLISGVVSAVGILVSYSRSAILLLLLLIILALLDQFKVKLKWTLVFFVMISVVLLAAVFISLRFSSGIVWTELIKPVNNQWLIDNSPEKRVFIWPVIGQLIIQRPWFGYGLENTAQAYLEFFQQIDFNINSIPAYYSLKDLMVNRAHNYLLDLFLFAGILGVLAWLCLVLILVKRLIEKGDYRHKNVLLVSLITYLVWIQFQNQSVVHLVYFWLLVGIIDQS